MKGESKNVKVARGKAPAQKRVFCSCGAEMIWVQWAPGLGSGRMVKVCEAALSQRNPLVCQKTSVPS